MPELTKKKGRPRGAVATILRDAGIVVLLSTLLGLGGNAVRSDAIPWVQKEAFDILVPCPEPVGDPEKISAGDPRIRNEKSILLDVRSKEEFKAWHIEGARNQPFDWLGPPVDEEVKTVAKQVAASRAQRVIVYGDGDDPDSGREWARLLSGARIKNVFYVIGGAPSLNPKLPKPGGLDLPPLEATAEAPPVPSSSALPSSSAAPSSSATPPDAATPTDGKRGTP